MYAYFSTKFINNDEDQICVCNVTLGVTLHLGHREEISRGLERAHEKGGVVLPEGTFLFNKLNGELAAFSYFLFSDTHIHKYIHIYDVCSYYT